MNELPNFINIVTKPDKSEVILTTVIAGKDLAWIAFNASQLVGLITNLQKHLAELMDHEELVLVPVKPTETMLSAASWHNNYEDMWKAMLQAAKDPIVKSTNGPPPV